MNCTLFLDMVVSSTRATNTSALIGYLSSRYSPSWTNCSTTTPRPLFSISLIDILMGSVLPSKPITTRSCSVAYLKRSIVYLVYSAGWMGRGRGVTYL